MTGRPYEYRIQNVVATASIGRRLDLKEITRVYQNQEYHPEVFPGLPFRLKKPRSVTLIFGAGKFICMGTKSEIDAKETVKKVLKKLEEVYKRKFRIPETIIVNIVASGDFYDIIDLEVAQYNLPDRYKCMYEPEQFPALMARDTKHYSLEQRGPVEKQGVFLLFNSGKFVCTGVKSEESVELRVRDMHQALFDTNCLFPRT